MKKASFEDELKQKINKFKNIESFFNGKKAEINRIKVIMLTAKSYTESDISEKIPGTSIYAIKKIWQEIAEKERAFFERKEKVKPKVAARNIYEYFSEIGFIEWYCAKGFPMKEADYIFKEKALYDAVEETVKNILENKHKPEQEKSNYISSSCGLPKIP